MDEDKEIIERLSSLEEEHEALNSIVDKGEPIDQFKAQRLKKRKLWLKDEISRLHSFLRPDIIA